MHCSYLWFSCHISLLPILTPSLTYKDPCAYIGPAWTIQEVYLILKILNLIKSVASLLPCKVLYSQVLEIKNIFGGPLFCMCWIKHVHALGFSDAFLVLALYIFNHLILPLRTPRHHPSFCKATLISCSQPARYTLVDTVLKWPAYSSPMQNLYYPFQTYFKKLIISTLSAPLTDQPFTQWEALSSPFRQF